MTMEPLHARTAFRTDEIPNGRGARVAADKLVEKAGLVPYALGIKLISHVTTHVIRSGA